MGIDTGLELNNDILYVQKVFNKCTKTYKMLKRNFQIKNKIFASRFYFVTFQFRNIFDNGYWV